MTKKHFIIVWFMAWLFATGFAQAVNKEKLDSLFACLDKNKKAMGSIAILKNSKMLYTKAIGYSLYNPGEIKPATENTKYRIGSISKIFTATIIFQLIEENKISLETCLDEYFPQFQDWKMITVSNLLNHRSGIPNITNIKFRDKARTHEEMLKIISAGRLQFAPGAKASYSNSNFLILGYIIEKIINKSYEDILTERIVSKIGLTDTYYGHKTNIKNNESFAYRLSGNWKQQPETDLSIPGGSGGIISTPIDMARFIEALFLNKLISRSSLDKMMTITDNYGMGVVQFEFDTKKAFGHPGGIDRFESVLAYFPGDSLAIAYCTNGQVYPVKDIVIGALDIYFNKEYSIPDFKLSSAKQGNLQKYAGIYFNKEIPLTIVIKKHKQRLVAQPAGHSSYQLEPTAPDKFKCDAASVVIEFNAGKDELKLKQGGMSYRFMKENN